jgi:thiol-disulfide isomerase/thioredoxin
MTATTDEPDELQLPRTNPLPLVVAAVGALVLLGGLVLLLTRGGEDDDPAASDVEDFLDGDDTVPEVRNEGEPVPEVAFDYFDGGEGTLDDFAGQPLVVNFWGEWCAPCVAEMPELQQVSEEYEGEVAFLGIDTNDAIDKGRDLAERTGVDYTLAHDPTGDEIAVAFGVQAMPTTVFIDGDGTIVRTWTGRIREDELRQAIEQDLVDEEPPQ